jgi:hypothetical protein
MQVKKDDEIVECLTCFEAQSKYNVCCQRRHCKNWINSACDVNCIVVAVKNGPKTLQEIGKIYGLTRMRICQIEKAIYEKIETICN